MLLLCAFTLSVFGYCVCLSERFSLDIEETPILMVSAIALALYVFSLANLLLPGVYILLAFGYALLIYTVIRRRKTLREWIGTVLKPGMAVYLLGILVIYRLAHAVIFSNWDEFSHWGLIVKIMEMTNALPGKGSMLTFPGYPPGTALFQYFAGILMGKSEGIVVFAQAFMVWSAAIAFVKGLKWKQFPLLVLALGVVYAGYVHFFGNSFWCIYVDGILGLTLASAFSLYFHTAGKRRPKDILKTIPLLGFVTLMKEDGILLALLFGLVVGVDQLYLSRHAEKPDRAQGGIFKKYPYISALSLAVLVPVVVNRSWALHLSAAGMGSTLVKIHQNANPGILSAFLKAAWNMAVGASRLGYEHLASAVVVLGLLLAACALFILMLKDRELRTRVSVIFGMLLLMIAIYSAGLVFLYTFKFNNYEGTNLASYGRYMGTIFLVVSLCVFRVMLVRIMESEGKAYQKLLPAAVFGLLVCCLIYTTSRTIIDIRVRTTHNALRSEIAKSVAMVKSAAKPSDRVYLIMQNTKGKQFLFAKYELYPIPVASAWSIGKPYGSADLWTKDISASDWAKQLSGCRFVYIWKADQPFIDRYGALFQSGSVKDNSVYAVQKNADGSVMLTPFE